MVKESAKQERQPSKHNQAVSDYAGLFSSPFSGTLNLNQIGTMVSKDTAAATKKGDFGLIYFHINVPRYEAGREINPILP